MAPGYLQTHYRSRQRMAPQQEVDLTNPLGRMSSARARQTPPPVCEIIS